MFKILVFGLKHNTDQIDHLSYILVCPDINIITVYLREQKEYLFYQIIDKYTRNGSLQLSFCLSVT